MLISKVRNMTSPRTDKPVANQFVITERGGIMGNFTLRETFQSYDTIIAVRTVWDVPATQRHEERIVLDEEAWNYSATTSKYRNQFLGETTKETKAKIKSGEYKLEDLNK